MLGTKHEKIVLIILAYIIGFNSGFIAFGLSKSPEIIISPFEPMIDESYEEPAVAEEVDIPVTTEVTEFSDDPVSYVDGKLYALAGGNRYVLSIDKKIIGDNVPDMLAMQGTHIAPPPFSLSPDNKFVFFCEPYESEAECLALIFDTTTNMIQYLNSDGKKVTVSADEAKTAVWSETGLQVGTYSSITSSEPWKVVTQ